MTETRGPAGWRLLRHGSMWMAIGPDYVDDVVSGQGYGPTPEDAVRRLALDRRTRGPVPEVAAFVYAGERRWIRKEGEWILELYHARSQ